MTQKERLVELYVNYYLQKDESKQFWLEDNRVDEYLKPMAEKIADYLLDNGVIVSRWISSNDQPPPEEVTLLGVNEYGAISTGEAYNGVWRFDNEWMADDEVKYWMTLPKPPEHLIKKEDGTE